MEMQRVVLDENVIPPMTHPWGQVWKQPDRNNLVLDDKYAVMYRRDFEMLPDYTGSEPTGKYNGKMWKAQYDSCGNRNGICAGVMMKIRYHRRYTFHIERF